MKICPKCQSEHTKLGTYCSHSCANSHGPMSTEQKKYRSDWAKKNPTGFVKDKRLAGRNPKIPEKHKIVKCLTCNIKFETLISQNKKFCSPNCVKMGGLRKGSGRGKSGYYKGFYLRSTYELAYLIHCLDHSIDIKSCDKIYHYFYKGKQHKYHPDFIVDGIVTEIKGFKTELVEIKSKSVAGPYQIFYKDDLKTEFSYVEKKTGLRIKDLYQLYE